MNNADKVLRTGTVRAGDLQKASSMERHFMLMFPMVCKMFVREFKFCPTRNWRFDFCDPENMIAVEIEGGAFVYGGHNRGKGFVDDCEKYTAAAALGWSVLRYATTEQMRDFPSHYRSLLERNATIMPIQGAVKA
jgi:very-short-patch-repair endonuclease